MLMQHSQRRFRLAPSIAFVALALAAGAPGLAQPADLMPLGTPVELAGTCAHAPTVFAAADGPIAVWQGAAEDEGLFARTGPAIDQLGPAAHLNANSIVGAVAVAPLSGGFAAAWVRIPVTQIPEVVFQRFGDDLQPEAAEVVVGLSSSQGAPALLADESGALTIAYYGPAGTVQARRYSSTDVPSTPPIEVDPAVASDLLSRIRLAAGDDGFLVAWEGALPAQARGLWVRSFASNGVPAAASVRITSLVEADFDVAWAEDEYLAVVPDGNVWGYRLDPNGTPTALQGLIAPATSPHHVVLAPGDAVLWMSFIEAETGLVVSRIELPSLTVFENPVLLVPEPIDNTYLARGSVATSGEGLLASWQLGLNTPISFPCAGAMGLYAQAFGPAPPVVDVPVTTPAGLLALALLIAAGGLLLLRR
jgi:hypothetical protein